MKRLILLLLIFYSAEKVFAQQDFRFADSTAQWNVFYDEVCWEWPCIYYHTEIFTPVSDTNINGIDYQIIQNITSNGFYIFVRKDSIGRVFYRQKYSWDTTEHLLYDFSLNAGESTIIYSFGDIECIVDSVDTVMLDRPRKRMFISYCSYHNSCNYSDIWIEGIGATLTSFATPATDYFVGDGPATELICFFEKDSLILHDSTVILGNQDTLVIHDCFIDSSWVGIDEENTNSGLKIYPHPVTQQSFIEFEKVYQNISLQVFDLTGKLVAAENALNTDRLLYDRKQMSNGIFIYSIVADGEVRKGKMVVQ